VVHGVKVGGRLKQHGVRTGATCKVPQRPTETVAPTQPSTAAGETRAPPPSKRQERSAQRLLEFQQKKRAELFGAKYGESSIARHEQLFQKRGHHPLLARAKLRRLLWSAWARYRPIFGGAVLRYTSLREQYVYRRAAQLYAAAFKSDPGKSGRPLAAWLRHATPMETETASVTDSAGSQPSKRAKKTHGSRARALPVA